MRSKKLLVSIANITYYMSKSPEMDVSTECLENLDRIRGDVKIGQYRDHQRINELKHIYESGMCEYQVLVSHYAHQEIKKLSHKDPARFQQLMKKLKEVLENPYHFKPLHGSLHGIHRIHVGSYVLTYEIDEKYRRIVLLHYQHHKHIYGKGHE
jgi:addiction module RelE/StbE family toxin